VAGAGSVVAESGADAVVATSSSAGLDPRKRLASYPVKVPKMPTPITMMNVPMNLPAEVTGY